MQIKVNCLKNKIHTENPRVYNVRCLIQLIDNNFPLQKNRKISIQDFYYYLNIR